MKYFRRIAEGLDVSPALEEIAKLGGLYPPDCSMQASAGLRNPEAEGTMILGEVHFPRYVAVSALLSNAQAAVGKPLVHSMLRIMPPNSVLKRHRDYLRPEWLRHQVVLQAGPGAVFTIKNEKCSPRPGELWSTDIGSRLHHVVNASELPRVTLIFDVERSPRAA